MEKEFIPYNQALDLKQLGFDEPCLAQYKKYDVGEATLDIGFSKNEIIMQFHKLSKFCSAPLYQQAFRWFREKGYFYGIEICQEKHPLKSKYTFSLYGKHFYEEDYPNQYGWIDDFPKFRTYEEAELECIKKLIEIALKK